MRILIALLTGLLIARAYGAGAAGAAETPGPATVDIEIVLAVDASGSVDRHELKLQLDGIAAAFRDPAIQRAIAQGAFQRIAVAMVIWSDAAYGKYPTQWHLVDSPQSAERFAVTAETFAKRHGAFSAIGGGGTGLGDGLAYALGMIGDNGLDAIRRIVDVSGDGPETTPWNEGAIALPEARAMAAARDVTVNGLAIETDEIGLTLWYRDNVLVGPGAFAMTARNFNDYRRAIRKKLLRELSPVIIGRDPPRADRTRRDRT